MKNQAHWLKSTCWLPKKADGKACIDYGFHTIVSDMRDDLLPEMDALVDEGVTTFKLFTAYPGVFLSDDAAIFKAMKRTAQNGGLILMHAENGPVIDVVAAELVAARSEGRSLTGFPGAVPASMPAAYQIQDLAMSLWPDSLVGWKIGYIPANRRSAGDPDRLVGPIWREQYHRRRDKRQ